MHRHGRVLVGRRCFDLERRRQFGREPLPGAVEEPRKFGDLVFAQSLLGDDILHETDGLDPFGRLGRRAPERIGDDLGGLKIWKPALNRLQFADGQEGRPLLCGRGGGGHFGHRLAGQRACHQDRVDLVVADRGGDVAGVEHDDLHLVGGDVILFEDNVEQLDVGVGARHDADAATGDLLDLFDLGKLELLSVLGDARAGGRDDHGDDDVTQDGDNLAGRRNSKIAANDREIGRPLGRSPQRSRPALPPRRRRAGEWWRARGQTAGRAPA